MRIYQIDGQTCFDTDDYAEVRLLDAYAAHCAEVGEVRAAARIAAWLDECDRHRGGAVVQSDLEAIARKIREGDWRDAP